MTDTTNGWPGKPGVPLNPEQSGWHLCLSPLGDDLFPCFWRAAGEASNLKRSGKWLYRRNDWDPKECTYLGPVLSHNQTTALQARVAKLEGALRQTVLLFKEILDAIDADPAETKLTLRKQGVAVKSITAAECFDKAATLLEGKKDE